MSTFLTHLTVQRRWATIDRRLGYGFAPGSKVSKDKLKARDAARSKYLRSIKMRIPFTTLPLELQLAIIEWLPYSDLKCLE